MENTEFLKELKSVLLASRVVAITGTSKNAGKTTTLNFMMKLLSGTPVGITSVGRDGEQTDVVTATPKPRIYISAGTVVTTSKQNLLESDATFEILSATGIMTPFGEVVIAKSRSCGFVELSGPSITPQLPEICRAIRGFGAKVVFVDGAFSRKTTAVPEVSDACMFCTGGAFCIETAALAVNTLHELNLLSLPQVDGRTASIFDSVMKDSSITFVYDGGVKKSDVKICTDGAEEIVRSNTENLRQIFISGAVTDRFFNKIIDSPFKLDRIQFVADDGTKLFLSSGTYRRFLSKGGKLTVRKAINVIGISVNPISPTGGAIDFDEFCRLMKAGTRIPVFNVKNFKLDVIE